jgi:hypothetical protein
VGLDGLHAEEQLGGDLRVGPALCDEPQDLGFAVGEVRLGEAAAWAAASGRESGVFVMVVIPPRCRATAARSSLAGGNVLPPARDVSATHVPAPSGARTGTL